MNTEVMDPRMEEDATDHVREAGPLVDMGGGAIIQSDRPTGAIRVEVKRDDRAVMQRLKTYAAMAGEDFFYRFPVKNRKENRTDYIEGASIKCANAVARAYGNCTIKVRAVDFPDHWIFYAQFCDLETGFLYERAFQQRKGQKTMGTDNARALDIVFQIGQSKAIRNVICNALSLFTDFAFDEAKQGMVTKIGKNMEGSRSKLIARFAELQIDIKRAEAIIGKTVANWLAPDMARVVAELQSIQDGMASIDDTYPPLEGQGEPRPTREDPKPEEKKAPETKAAEPEKPAETKKADAPKEEPAKPVEPKAQAKRQEFLDWIGDQHRALEKVVSVDALDLLEENVLKELGEEPEERKRWNDATNAKARSLMRPKDAKKGK